ncbi:MAG: DUF459 domain-containing protein [Rhizobiales bacterium]|nr:DUF459 domain-containing protein [Hyphomicrobiales bacterium]
MLLDGHKLRKATAVAARCVALSLSLWVATLGLLLVGGGFLALAPSGGVVFASEADPGGEAGPRRILIIGDSLGGQLYIGLYEAYRGDKTVKIDRLTKISSGMVRDDFYDWNKAAEEIAERERADIVIMMLGGNDNQPIRVEGQRYREKLLTDLWKETYAARVEALIRSFTSRGARFYWVGMPIQKNARDDAVGQAINGIFSAESAKAGSGYIDTYELFSGPGGTYVTHLTDDQGNRKLMRESDGMHFSNSGVKWLGRVVKAIIARDDAALAAAVTEPATEPQAGDSDGADPAVAQKPAGGTGQSAAAPRAGGTSTP